MTEYLSVEALNNQRRFALTAAEVFTPEGIIPFGFVHVEDGHIVAVESKLQDGFALLDLGEGKLLPGLIDQHSHGRLGSDTMDKDKEALTTIADGAAACGVVAIAPTTVTAQWEDVLAAVERVKMHIDTNNHTSAEVLGSYIEGPFFTPPYKGAHPEALFVPPTPERIEQLLVAAQGTLKVVALAAELPEAPAAVRQLSDNGVRVSIGHTDSTYAQVHECINAGASIGVHLFNGMSPLHHREPGCVGALLSDHRATCEIIADTIHVHPAVLKLSWQCKGSDRMVLITDSMRAAGMPDGHYTLGELDVTVTDSIARIDNGSLAGSTLALNRAIYNMSHAAGVPELDAVNMASLTPAKMLGVDDRLGSIEVGKEASFAVTDEQFNVELTVRQGKIIYKEGR